jgi:hypothetical protein
MACRFLIVSIVLRRDGSVLNIHSNVATGQIDAPEREIFDLIFRDDTMALTSLASVLESL